MFELLDGLITKKLLTVCRYTHVEAECAFITFNDLLDYLEDLICDVVDRVMKSPAGQLILDLNPVRKSV